MDNQFNFFATASLSTDDRLAQLGGEADRRADNRFRHPPVRSASSGRSVLFGYEAQ
jgi:hypothetical protein